ncbi:MAG TPA: hypothetical protein IAC59_03535 [Candidatus Fimadaptatus faecigallinarum]|uniref:Uncharacterized protein n=1 Tax=Candidatus Fimadaptatus faecigallinarum TaxID=2840814 RepID=A0A9D1LQS0_9FIRM|nr:hypothetical protein [Candidatus Fimadaptatus faecigallinarum]
MIKPREYMEGLRRCAARMERAAGEIGRAAQQGLVPDAAVLDELESARNELGRLRGELNALLERLRAEWADSATLTLEQLEERVDEWELRERMGAGIVGRIGDAAERLERLHAPGCGIAPVRELARQAADALEACDMERLNGLEAQAMPYLDMCVLLSGDMDAVRRDGELLRRLEKWYPQVVWYVRARMRLQQGTVGFDEISDNAVAELRQSRLDPRVERELSTLHSAYDTEMERVSQAESDSHSDQRRPHCTASHTRRKSGAASGSTARPGTQRISSDNVLGLDAHGDTVGTARPSAQRISSDVMPGLDVQGDTVSTARPGTQRISSDNVPGLDAHGDTVSASQPGAQRISSDVMPGLDVHGDTVSTARPSTQCAKGDGEPRSSAKNAAVDSTPPPGTPAAGSTQQPGAQHAGGADARHGAARRDGVLSGRAGGAGISAERRARMVAEINVGIHGEVARRIGALDRAGVGVTDWRALAGDYPELPALRELAARHAAGDARADGYAALERRALAQAQALDEIIEDARAYLAHSVSVRPENAALARAWAAMMTPGRGTIFSVLEAVATRRRGNYERVSALCGRLMIDGLPNGLRLQRLSELAPELNGDKLVELLRLLMPGLLVLGRWQALRTGEIARRMGRVQVEHADGGELRLNEQYAPANAYRRASGRVWRLSGAQPGIFNRRK